MGGGVVEEVEPHFFSLSAGLLISDASIGRRVGSREAERGFQ